MPSSKEILGKVDTVRKALERLDRPLKKKILKREGPRFYEAEEEESLYFAQIDFGKPKRRPVLQFDKGRGPVYNPLTTRFYTQRLVWYDDEWGWIIQGDIILMWLVTIGIIICSIL